KDNQLLFPPVCSQKVAGTARDVINRRTGSRFCQSWPRNEGERERLVRYSARSRRVPGRADSKALSSGICGALRVVRVTCDRVHDRKACMPKALRRFAPRVTMVQAPEALQRSHFAFAVGFGSIGRLSAVSFLRES